MLCPYSTCDTHHEPLFKVKAIAIINHHIISEQPGFMWSFVNKKEWNSEQKVTVAVTNDRPHIMGHHDHDRPYYPSPKRAIPSPDLATNNPLWMANQLKVGKEMSHDSHSMKYIEEGSRSTKCVSYDFTKLNSFWSDNYTACQFTLPRRSIYCHFTALTHQTGPQQDFHRPKSLSQWFNFKKKKSIFNSTPT